MALANQMKIVLTLDDKGFGVSAKKIGDDVKGLAERFMGLADNAGKVQSTFNAMSRDLEGVAGRVGDVQKALADTAAAMQKNVADGVDAATKAATEKWK